MKLSAADAKTIKTRVQTAENFRDRTVKADYLKSWSRYKGQPYGQRETAAKTQMTVCYDWPIIETKLHSIGFNYPDFVVNPMTDAAQNFAEVAQTALAYEWRRCEVQEEAKACLLDRMICGMGIALVTWQFETEAMDDGDVDASDAYIVEGGRLPVEGDKSSAPSEENKDDYPEQTISQEQVIKDQPLVLRIDPLAFFAHPEATNKLNRAAFCGFVEFKPLEEVKRDPRFKNTRNLKGNSESLQSYLAAPEGRELSDEDVPTDIKRVKLIHYYEKLRKVHVILTDEHDKPLLSEKWSWEFDGYPFAILAGTRTPNDFWARPDNLYWEHSVKEIEQAAATQAANTRAGIVKVVMKGDPATPSQKNQMRSLVPYTCVELNNNQMLEPLPMPQQQVELAQVFTRAEAQIQFLAGLNGYQMSAPPSKRTPGIEVQAISQAGSPRALNDRQMFEDFCTDVLGKMLSLSMQYNTVARNLPVYDNETQAVAGWLHFDAGAIRKALGAKDVKKHFEVTVHVGSTVAPNSADTLENVSYFLQALLPVAQAYPILQQIGIDLKPVILAAARSIPGIRNLGQIIKPIVGQMQQEATDPQSVELQQFLTILAGHPAITPPQQQLLGLIQALNSGQLAAPGGPGSQGSPGGPMPPQAGGPPMLPPGGPPMAPPGGPTLPPPPQ